MRLFLFLALLSACQGAPSSISQSPAWQTYAPPTGNGAGTPGSSETSSWHGRIDAIVTDLDGELQLDSTQRRRLRDLLELDFTRQDIRPEVTEEEELARPRGRRRPPISFGFGRARPIGSPGPEEPSGDAEGEEGPSDRHPALADLDAVTLDGILRLLEQHQVQPYQGLLGFEGRRLLQDLASQRTAAGRRFLNVTPAQQETQAEEGAEGPGARRQGGRRGRRNSRAPRPPFR